MYRILAILLALLFALSACGEASAPAAASDTPLITYKHTLSGRLRLEVLAPTDGAGDASPAVLAFFGGGWVTGSRDQFAAEFAPLIEDLRADGIAVILADYRLATDGRTWRDCLDDCEDALAYVRRNAKKLRIDPERVGVMGYSAGAHLALMTAIKADGAAVCVSLSGPSVMTFQWGSDFYSEPLEYYRGIAFGGGDYSDASPKTQLGRRCETAFLLVNGVDDAVIPPAHASAFAAEAAVLDVEAELMLTEGLTHSYASFAELDALCGEVAAWVSKKFYE